MLPALFLSHGAPTLPLTDAPARHFLKSLPALLAERPRAILAVSAHWETMRPTVNAVAVNETIHDFYGFPRELYAMRYPAPGSAALAQWVAGLLSADIDTSRGLDHGAWVPLAMMYPRGDIPVVQLSVQSNLGPVHSFAVGRALAPLRDEGVLVIGSGSFTHDLSEFRNYLGATGPDPDWVTGFADWFTTALTEGRTGDLLKYRSLAPFAAKNHPTEEHLLPLFVALGAGGEGVTHLHQSTTFSILRMDAFAFGPTLPSRDSHQVREVATSLP